jgi:hypothetical protein
VRLVFENNGLRINEISSIQDFSELSQGIILLHFDKVPPHLGFVMHHVYYSITSRAVDILSFDYILKLINKKKIPCLILETKALTIDAKQVKAIFQNEGLVGEQTSCLNPLKKIFSKTLDMPINAEVIFDLIKVITYKQNLTSAFSNITTQEIFIPFYSKNEVEAYIRKLKR